MKFVELEIPGAYRIELAPIADERGSFTRTFCRRTWEERGLNAHVAQCNVTTNRRRGTVRGLHYQAEPHAEAKLIRVVRGRVFDVIVDLRPGSPTRLRWVAVTLTAGDHSLLYVPEGCAHGYQTLEEETELFYQMSAAYHPEAARGLRPEDPALAIPWPLPVSGISERDRSFPLL